MFTVIWLSRAAGAEETGASGQLKYLSIVSRSRLVEMEKRGFPLGEKREVHGWR